MFDLQQTDEQLRQRIRKMSDADLIRWGRAARSMATMKDAREVFKVQLAEARAEWRRRYLRTEQFGERVDYLSSSAARDIRWLRVGTVPEMRLTQTYLMG
jgi:hypothetical protein